MNIKEIANLAGVSVSTVSKVINHKDENLKKETVDKVMEVVNQYQFTPYAKNRTKLLNEKNIGLILEDYEASSIGFLRAFEPIAFAHGYSVFVCAISDNWEQLEKYQMVIKQKNVSGVVAFSKQKRISKNFVSGTEVHNILHICLADTKNARFQIDYSAALKEGIQQLIDYRHKNIALALSRDEYEKNRQIIQIFRETMECNGLIFNGGHICYEDELLFQNDVTAYICGNITIARKLYEIAYIKKIAIPKEISIMSIDQEGMGDCFFPTLSTVQIPMVHLAQTVFDILEEEGGSDKSYSISCAFKSGASIGEGNIRNAGKIVVVGSINMDIVTRMAQLPEMGDTIIAQKKDYFPGGKGANQAVAIGKLNGNVFLIGLLGNDLFGKEMYQELIRNNVDVQGVTLLPQVETGNANIYVAENGDSHIVVYPGASNQLTPIYITQKQHLFHNAQYCLIQQEIHLDTIYKTIEVCHQQQINVILKPAPVRAFDIRYYHNLFALVPNEKELSLLVPDEDTLEKKCACLFSFGIQNVIVTLGAEGAFLYNGQIQKYFSTYPVDVVDSTGASDVFIGAFAYALSRGFSMEVAIDMGNYSAAMSVAREGVQSSMIDYYIFENFLTRSMNHEE